MKFCLFSDFHYKKLMYVSTVDSMDEIIEASKKENVDFILHGGDFCNDYCGSPELLKHALLNKYNIPFYGVYGNHELESENNSMQVVTEKLTNRPENAVWGTENGKINDGSIAYYYFDCEDFRIICLDTNYSWNTTYKEWEHNRTSRWCPPPENVKEYSLGEKQIKWFQSVIDDSVLTDKHCIIISHVPFLDEWRRHEDNKTVIDIINNANKRKELTVIACLSGHYHTNRYAVSGNVLFFDINAVINGLWEYGHTEDHYDVRHTYAFTDYDADGNEIRTENIPLNKAFMSKETWYFATPLFATVEVRKDCSVIIKGKETDWRFGIVPKTNDPAVMPKIYSVVFNPKRNS